MGKLFIMAGNYGEAKYWADQWKLRSNEWVYLDRPEQVLGQFEFRVARVGRFMMHPRYDRLREEIGMRQARVLESDN